MGNVRPFDRSHRRRPDPTGRMRAKWQRRRPRRRWPISPVTILIALAFVLVGAQRFAGLPIDAMAGAPRDHGLTSDAATSRQFTSFSRCASGGGYNCVVDGDTFWFGGEKIRIADIDTPETHPSRCDREGELGARATDRLHALLNEGPFVLAPSPDGRTHDRYGRRLAIVTRNGNSVGALMVSEGLARRYSGGPRDGWC